MLSLHFSYMYICVLYRSSILSEPVPDVLVQLITGFETFLKNQKAESDLISKYSDTSMKKVLQDTATQSQVYVIKLLSIYALFFTLWLFGHL